MDIALIIHELIVEGGGERQCVCLARALSERGHEVTLYTSAYDRFGCFPETCRSFAVKETGRGFLPWLRRPLFCRGYLDMRRLVAVVKDKHQIWNPHHWPAQWGAVWLKAKLGGAVVWMCNDVPDFRKKYTKPGGLINWFRAPFYFFYYEYDHWKNQSVDLTLLLSRWAESEYRATYAGETSVVRSGADPDRFQPAGNRAGVRRRFSYSETDFVLLWLGIFMPHRRLEDLIHAAGRVLKQGAKVKLLLAGSASGHPEYFNSLRDLVKSLGLQNTVTFAGKVADEEIRDFYCACDAFVFPNDQQTWGLAVLEAMSCGCLAMVSTGAGVHEVLTDGVDALLFEARNPAMLADKIAQLVSRPEWSAEVAHRGMQLARNTYNWERFAAQIETICEQYLDPSASEVSISFPSGVSFP